MAEKKENKSSYSKIFEKCSSTKSVGSEDFEKCCDDELNKNGSNLLNTAENIVEHVLDKNTNDKKPEFKYFTNKPTEKENL